MSYSKPISPKSPSEIAKTAVWSEVGKKPTRCWIVVGRGNPNCTADCNIDSHLGKAVSKDMIKSCTYFHPSFDIKRGFMEKSPCGAYITGTCSKGKHCEYAHVRRGEIWQNEKGEKFVYGDYAVLDKYMNVAYEGIKGYVDVMKEEKLNCPYYNVVDGVEWGCYWKDCPYCTEAGLTKTHGKYVESNYPSGAVLTEVDEPELDSDAQFPGLNSTGVSAEPKKQVANQWVKKEKTAQEVEVDAKEGVKNGRVKDSRASSPVEEEKEVAPKEKVEEQPPAVSDAAHNLLIAKLNGCQAGLMAVSAIANGRLNLGEFVTPNDLIKIIKDMSNSSGDKWCL
jgi:hypothetical protein